VSGRRASERVSEPEPEPEPVREPEPIREPEAEPIPEPNREPEAEPIPEPEHGDVGPETAQMSMVLADLGFTGDENPLLDESEHATDDPVEVDPVEVDPVEVDPVEVDRPVETADVSDFAAREDPSDAGLIPLVLPEPVPARSDPAPSQPAPAPDPDPELTESETKLTEPEPTDPDPEPTEPEPEPTEPEEPSALVAPPVTGELDWEQLMWQATQEIDESEAEAAADSKAEPGSDPGDAQTREEG
jgi:HAE1 family hydrophobic/amphiphilic exporter-1